MSADEEVVVVDEFPAYPPRIDGPVTADVPADRVETPTVTVGVPETPDDVVLPATGAPIVTRLSLGAVLVIAGIGAVTRVRSRV